MTLHILVKDYGKEGLAVHGITDNDAIVAAWEAGDPSNRSIMANPAEDISYAPLPLCDRYHADSEEGQ